MKTKQLALDAMLAAMCAVLGYIALDTGNIKVTFESLPILIGAFLFGPLDGLAIAGVGTFIYQVTRYTFSVTTFLWMLPYMLAGFLVGLYARHWKYHNNDIQLAVAVILSELMVFLLNTGVIYVDSIVYGYYSFAYVFGSFFLRLVICIGKSVVFSLLMPALLKSIRQILHG